jgi:O-antigen/teichoic acid export membrane protein
VTSVHNAVICTPFTAVVSRLTGAERIWAADGFYWLQLLAASVVAVALAVGAFSWTVFQGHPDPWMGLAMGFAVLGSCAREFRRTEYFLKEDLRGLLVTDGGYVLTGLIVLGVGMKLSHGLSASLALFAVGVSGLFTGLRRTVRDQGDVLGVRLGSHAWGLAREQARWTFPWTVISWLQNSSYPYLIALCAGALAVADAGAARLMIMPVTLFSVGWNRLFFARAGRRLGTGSRGDVWSLATRGVAMLAVIVLIYCAAPLALTSLRGGALLPEKYRHLTGLVLAWSVYFLVTTLRGVGSAALLAHQEARSLFRVSAIAALVSLPIALFLGRAWGPAGLILGLAGGEAGVAVSVWSTLAGLTRGERSRVAIPQRGDSRAA